MNKEELLEKYNNFYQYYSYENFINMMFDYEQRKQNQENLIKYLKGLLTGNKTTDMFVVTGVQDLLERIKNNNYES